MSSKTFPKRIWFWTKVTIPTYYAYSIGVFGGRNPKCYKIISLPRDENDRVLRSVPLRHRIKYGLLNNLFFFSILAAPFLYEKDDHDLHDTMWSIHNEFIRYGINRVNTDEISEETINATRWLQKKPGHLKHSIKDRSEEIKEYYKEKESTVIATTNTESEYKDNNTNK